MKKVSVGTIIFVLLVSMFHYAPSPVYGEPQVGPQIVDAYTNDEGTEVLVKFDQELDNSVKILPGQVGINYKGSARTVDSISYSSTNNDTIIIKIEANPKYTPFYSDGLTTVKINVNTVSNTTGTSNELILPFKVRSKVPPYKVMFHVVRDGEEISADDLIFFQSEFGDASLTFDLTITVTDQEDKFVIDHEVNWVARDTVGNMKPVETKQTNTNGEVTFNNITLLSDGSAFNPRFQYISMLNVPARIMYYVPTGYSFVALSYTDDSSFLLMDTIDENNLVNFNYLGDLLPGVTDYMIVDPKTTAFQWIITNDSPAVKKVLYGRVPVSLTANQAYQVEFDNKAYRKPNNFTILRKNVSALDPEIIAISTIKVMNTNNPNESFSFNPITIGLNKVVEFWIPKSITFENMNVVISGQLNDGSGSSTFIYVPDTAVLGTVVNIDFASKSKIFEDVEYTYPFGDYIYNDLSMHFARTTDQSVLGNFRLRLYTSFPVEWGGPIRTLYHVMPEQDPTVSVRPLKSDYIYIKSFGTDSYLYYFEMNYPPGTIPITNELGGDLTIEAEKSKLYKGDTQNFIIRSTDGSVLTQILKNVAGRPKQEVQIEVKKDGDVVETILGNHWTIPTTLAVGEYTAELVDAYGFPIDPDNSTSFTVQNRPAASLPSTPSLVITEKITTDQVRDRLAKLTGQSRKTVRIDIPNTTSDVKEVNVSIPKDAVRVIADAQANLEIYTAGVLIEIPADSMQGFDEDLYFRVVPVRDGQDQQAALDRAKRDPSIQQIAANSATITILGNPMTIETNIQNHPVTLTLPITNLPNDEEGRAAILENLAVYIEHSDGTKELVNGTIVTNSDGSLSVQIVVDKFSTFVLLYVDGWAEYQATRVHQPYMMGYPDGTFRPDQGMTRAQFAALLSRIIAGEPTDESTISYTDVSKNHWAVKGINLMTRLGYMKGYTDGSFKPNKFITRAEVATVLAQWKASEISDNGLSISWDDVSGHWAESSIRLIGQMGWMYSNGGSSFRPNANVTRAEVVESINNALKRGPLGGVESSIWGDVSPSHWAFEHINEASIPHRYLETSNGEKYQPVE